ncbi:MAG: glutathione peroxidase [Oligoflexia bacterium]|nr:glutathione peroxidase [Oligoflexia bacterium]
MIYDITVQDSKGKNVQLSDYKGKTLLIVNVASKCGYTPQYEGLEALYKKFKDKNFVILGFPCNQFGGQEPGSDEEIQKFCKLNYGVSFPVMAKVDVNGKGEHELYKLLKSEAPGILGTEKIKWNFTKFLVSKSGQVLKRYAPADTPESLEKEIEKLLLN